MKKKKVKEIGITALYERLSRDDDGDGDSNSIVHQKQMLETYAKEHGFINLRHYTDDGWSGASFDRPAWNELVSGVKDGKITTVIVKDLSRVGRDHLQVGFFTDILFREKEVRFIAVGNSIDSNDQQSNEFAPFLNIMNEWYVRDTSKKIKAVLKSRGMSGKAHTSNSPCYGYVKDPENPDHWVVDEEAAAIVRRIFQMSIDGKGPYEIARCLAESKVERPSYYLAKKGIGNHQSDCDYNNPYMWRGNTVASILDRLEYTGCTVNQEKLQADQGRLRRPAQGGTGHLQQSRPHPDEVERQHSGGFFGIGCRIFCAAIQQRRVAHPTGNLAAGHLRPEKHPQIYRHGAE